MGEAVATAVRDGITHIIFGDLFLRDIRAYREQKLAGTGITPVFPLWERPTLPLAQAMIADGFEAYLATVDLNRLPAEFAGRKFDRQLLADFPDGIDPCGENGEFHTCVVAAPIFTHRLAIATGERVDPRRLCLLRSGDGALTPISLYAILMYEADRLHGHKQPAVDQAVAGCAPPDR